MVRKLYVEVCNAVDLMPKDGQGSCSPYCVLDYDSQRKKTEVKAKELSPVWNTKYDFLISDPSTMECDVLEINVYSEKKVGKRRPGFLGRVRIPGHCFVKQGEETIVYYALQKRNIFSHTKGELGVKVWYNDEPDEPAPPPPEPAPAADATAAPEAAPAPAEEAKPDAPAAVEATPAPADSPAAPPDGAAPPAPPPEEEKPPEKKEEQVQTILHSCRPSIVHPSDYVLKETRPAIPGTVGEKVATYDLVEKMQYLFVRVVKARNLAAKDVDGSSDPYVKITLGIQGAKTYTVAKSLNPEWNQVFAFGNEGIGGHILEITVWDEDTASKDDFLGSVAFDLNEIPTRVPPDSPLAPQWYRLEETQEGRGVKGSIMLAVWMGTQADEAFTEAWQSDSGGYTTTRSKVYLSPKLWYLRVNVIEAQEVQPFDKMRFPDVIVRAQLGYQIHKTRASHIRSMSPFWNEDLLFVAAEPFEDELKLLVEDRVGPDKHELLGYVKIPLSTIDKIPLSTYDCRRVDYSQVRSRWFNLERNSDGKASFHGRLHLRVCFDGGYHVMDESTNHISCMQPTAKQLWRPSIGVLELGIIRGKDLLPMKTKDGRGTTDAYCVAKYGQKWIRTRTIVDSFNPRWNEPYTWEVYDPCTVLTVGVIDNCQMHAMEKNGSEVKDVRIGKVRIRLSTLESGRVYTNRYPLLMLHQSGVKKMGEIELAVRFSVSSTLNVMQLYFRPLLPRMHYLQPLGVTQSEILRIAAMRIVANRLSRTEPPLRQEVVHYMLDSDFNVWSLRRSKANYCRILNVLSSPIAVVKWFDSICKWKNSLTTILVHLLFLILVWYPELILPTLFLYMSLIGAWQYRFRPRSPPSMDAKLSLAENVEADELDEEFDPIPSTKGIDNVRVRYDRLRIVSGRIQAVLGDLATQGERICALFSWRDPRATAIAIAFCLVVAITLYVVPLRLVAVLLGLYLLRHPRFRDPLPAVPLSFFRRLPSLADRIL